jgi:hypothetical protein
VHRNLGSWWEQEAPGPICDFSTWLVHQGALDCIGERIAGVVIRSSRNPMAPMLESAWGLFCFGVFPVMAYAALCAFSVVALRQHRSRQGPESPLVRLVLVSNAVIMGVLVALFLLGGGALGILLPDLRRPWKMLNYAALSGSSAGVDILLALIVGSIIRNEPPGTKPPTSGLVCAACLVALDLTQAVCLAELWPSAFVYTFLLPSVLLVAKLACSLLLTWRVLALQRGIWATAESDRFSAVSAKLFSFRRRLVVAGVGLGRRVHRKRLRSLLTRLC